MKVFYYTVTLTFAQTKHKSDTFAVSIMCCVKFTQAATAAKKSESVKNVHIVPNEPFSILCHVTC